MKLKSSKWLKAQLRGRYLLMRLPEDQKKNSDKREKFLDGRTVAMTNSYGPITYVDTTVKPGGHDYPDGPFYYENGEWHIVCDWGVDIHDVDLSTQQLPKPKKHKRKNKNRKPRKLQDKVN